MNNIKSIMMGYRDIKETKEKLTQAINSDIELIELIIPFSDIMANSSELIKMNNCALENKISIDEIFNLIPIKTNKKLVISSYINPIFRYGYDKFFKNCAQNNISYVNIYDLPQSEIGEIEEYLIKYDIQIFNDKNFVLAK